MAASNANDQFAGLLLWRSCENQRKAYTWPLVDDMDELDALEKILESSKPPTPDNAPTHPLLCTPFRYNERTPTGSRFVRHGAAGAMYSAIEQITCMHESGHWAYRFVMASEGLAEKSRAIPRTLFQFSVAGQAINLLREPFIDNAPQWMHPTDYTATQEIGSYARANSIPLVMYASVRDPAHRPAVAVMLPTGISCDKPYAIEDWELLISANQIVWRNSHNDHQHIISV